MPSEKVRMLLDEFPTQNKQQGPKEERDVVCDIWLDVFGVVPGIGRNCPNGAYEFARRILEEAQKPLSTLTTKERYELILQGATDGGLLHLMERTIIAFKDKHGLA